MANVETIRSMMEEKRVFNPPKEFSERAYIRNLVEYKETYQWSIDDPEGFWGRWQSSSIGIRSGIRCLLKTSKKASMNGLWGVNSMCVTIA